MVMDAMLLAGEAAGRFALAAGVPFPYSTQPPPDEVTAPTGLAAMFAARKGLKRSQLKSAAEPHAGLGLEVYTQATSPLRRYLDLVAHQQLRAHLRGAPPIPVETMVERVGAAEALIGNLRRAERASNTHWKLVYLKRHPGWCGTGVLVERRGGRGTVVIPELGLDVAVSIGGDPPLDAAIPLRLSGVDLPGLEVHFQC
jgi:exoribonuclease-2